MTAWGNFVAAEEHGTENVQFSDDGVTASVTLRVPYATRMAAASDLLANRRPWPKTVPGLVPLARAVGVTPVPTTYLVDAGFEVIAYEQALLNVQYSTIELAQPTIDSIEPTAEFITLDFRCFRWGGPLGLPVFPEEAPGLLLRGFNFVRTFADRTFPPHTDYVTLVGHVNDAPVTSSTLGFTFGAETLLYQPPNISWAPRVDGTTRYNATVKGTFKPETWNKYWLARTQSWEFMHLVGDPNPYRSYPLADMTAVWNYDPLP